MKVQERTVDEQRMSALQKANEVRSKNRRLKEQIARGEVDWRDVLRNPPEHARSMLVCHLLEAVPRMGPVRADMLLNVAGVSPAMKIGRLTTRQAKTIAADSARERRPDSLRLELRRLRLANEALQARVYELEARVAA